MEKHADQRPFSYPPPSSKISIDLTSIDGREKFLLDIRRGSIAMRGTFQNRVYTTEILARLDYGGQPHTNPDGGVIRGTHLHVYKEGFGDKWAILLPCDGFHTIDTQKDLYTNFLKFCNITRIPNLIDSLL
jgi:hypothetical protein